MQQIVAVLYVHAANLKKVFLCTNPGKKLIAAIWHAGVCCKAGRSYCKPYDAVDFLCTNPGRTGFGYIACSGMKIPVF